jgi:hypothetical protein
MHVPFNFGNTIEEVALFVERDARIPFHDRRAEYHKEVNKMSGGAGYLDESFAVPSKPSTWEHVNSIKKLGGEVWGHMNPDLQQESNETGCPLYLTPQKYWPVDLKRKYFGDKKIFGVLRDPYERLVSQFRGDHEDYGGTGGISTCDLNGAVKASMKELLNGGNIFAGACTKVPQSEYFDGPYGISIPVDNWRFPQSANELFKDHGYHNFHIRQKDIMNVFKCADHWSAEFDKETRQMIREFYKKDFDLLCKSFGYCDFDQDTCLQGVEMMCPDSVFRWNSSSEIACPKRNNELASNVRMRDEC